MKGINELDFAFGEIDNHGMTERNPYTTEIIPITRSGHACKRK